jgi:hypothetical protein
LAAATSQNKAMAPTKESRRVIMGAIIPVVGSGGRCRAIRRPDRHRCGGRVEGGLLAHGPAMRRSGRPWTLECSRTRRRYVRQGSGARRARTPHTNGRVAAGGRESRRISSVSTNFAVPNPMMKMLSICAEAAARDRHRHSPCRCDHIALRGHIHPLTELLLLQDHEVDRIDRHFDRKG